MEDHYVTIIMIQQLCSLVYQKKKDNCHENKRDPMQVMGSKLSEKKKEDMIAPLDKENQRC